MNGAFVGVQSQEPRLNRGDGTFAVVMVPTRELAVQIHDVLSNILRRYFWLVCVYLTLSSGSCFPYFHLS